MSAPVRAARRAPIVGLALPARERGAARHRRGALHRRPGRAAPRTSCTPGRCRRRTPTRAITGLRPKPAYDVPGVVRVLTAEDVPGRQRRRRQARRAAVPRRGDVPRPRGLLGARRDPRGGPARRRRGRGRLRAAARADHGRARRSRRGASRAASRTVRARRRRGRPGRRRPTCSAASSSSPARSTSTWRPTARWRTVDEAGQVFVQSSTQHPSETQEIVAHVLGLHSHEVTVQCLRMGGGFGGKEMQPHGFAAIAALGRDAHRPAGPAAAQPHPGHDHVRQAARLPRPLAGRLRRRRPAAGAGRDADLRRRLEPRPVRAGAGPGAVPHRQRLLDPERPGERPDRARPTRPRRRRSAGSAARRGCW